MLHLRGKIIESDRVVEADKVDNLADVNFKKATENDKIAGGGSS